MSLQVIEPGLCSLLVDRGRPGSRNLGVPVGGAADRTSLALGNALVGNALEAAALEICLVGPVLRATQEIAAVVYGAPFEISSQRQRLEPGVTFTLAHEEEISLGRAATGVHAYLCVRGGFEAPLILGSRSALEPLHGGEELRCAPSSIHRRFIRPESKWNAEPRTLRVLPGAQADWFASAEFFAQEFSVTPASNRMGLRLQARPLQVPARELVSEPVCPGSVQVTRDGQCIILGVDGQTIGGYPKIAQVISADLDKLGQLRPNESIRFREVSLSDAEALYRAKESEIGEWLVRLQASGHT